MVSGWREEEIIPWENILSMDIAVMAGNEAIRPAIDMTLGNGAHSRARYRAGNSDGTR
jgi:hypothetical protein